MRHLHWPKGCTLYNEAPTVATRLLITRHLFPLAHACSSPGTRTLITRHLQWPHACSLPGTYTGPFMLTTRHLHSPQVLATMRHLHRLEGCSLQGVHIGQIIVTGMGIVNFRHRSFEGEVHIFSTSLLAVSSRTLQNGPTGHFA